MGRQVSQSSKQSVVREATMTSHSRADDQDVLSCMEDYRIPLVPESAFYIKNFITKDEETFLLDEIYKVPKPKWTQLSSRRLQNWGGLPHPKVVHLSKGDGMVSEPLPHWLEKYAKKLHSSGIFGGKKPNHVLVNEYQSGEGIMPHLDGPLFYPVISTISLGSGTLLEFYKPRQEGEDENIPDNSTEGLQSFTSIYLAQRSLIVLRDDMYTKYLHGISEKKEDVITDSTSNLCFHSELSIGNQLNRTCRISLTIRHVPKVLKLKLRLGK